MTIDDIRHIPSVAASRRLGLSPNTLRIYATRYGVGERLGHDWLFSPRDLDVIVARMRAQRSETVNSLDP